MGEANLAGCNVCGSHERETVFRSQGNQSLTSLCQLLPGKVEVSFCSGCGHIQSNVLEDVDQFYESDYTILINHEDEDQVYETSGDEIIYRTDHQLRVLQEKLPLEAGMRILDYGCAKADMSRKIRQSRDDVALHMFDVSSMYLPFWEKITDSEHWAIHETPESWEGHFDLVMSYFAFEHIPDPVKSAAHVASLLREGGVFYAIVPDTFGNIADFVVSDHVNHFTDISLTHLLERAGFEDIEVDSSVHRGAHVVKAVRSKSPTAANTPIDTKISTYAAKANEIAAFWNGIGETISDSEIKAEAPAAIYGSGFYGAFIYSNLTHPEKITHFLDKNPFQQGRTLFDVPIVSPDALPQDTKTLYIGLNPAIARKAIGSMPELAEGGRKLVFLT